MRLCADFHAGPSKEYLIFFLIHFALQNQNVTDGLRIFVQNPLKQSYMQVLSNYANMAAAN